MLLLTATNITYLLVSLFILYVGIILYVDGDYLYNKVKDFTLRRCELKFKAYRKFITFLLTGSNVQRNTVKRLQTDSGLNYLTDTLTSAWDAMRANFGVGQKAAAPHGWLTRHRWPCDPISLFSSLRAFSHIVPSAQPIATLLSLSFKAVVHHPFYSVSPVSARIAGPRRGHLGLLVQAGGAQRGRTGETRVNYPTLGFSLSCALYRKRRRKFVRKRPTEVASVYEDTSYRRKVPKNGETSGGGYYGHQGASQWYSGDYESDFRSSHDYQDTRSENLYYEEGPRDKSEESWVYRDIAFSDSDWSQRRQLEGLAPEVEEEEEYQYYEY